ncbi:MAG: right-handed parallel beta-helix repeat-containing protein [Phycisphaerae bacterium]|nr:right-handed parallel beta-helix repeat-containing protein [Phycisphaerae bacterium]
MKVVRLLICVLCCANAANAVEPSELYCQVAGSTCLSFDGGDMVTLGNDPSLQLAGNLAVTTWVRLSPGTDGLYMGVVGKMNGARGFCLVRRDNNRFCFWTGDGFGYTGQNSTQMYTDSEWHHLAGVVSNGTSQLYVDGVLQQAGVSNGVIADSGQFAYVGRQYSSYEGRYLKGQVDDVRFYDHRLTDFQVVDVLSGLPEEDAGLKGYWAFNDGQGQVVQDGSGYGNHGILGLSTAVESSDPTWTDTGCVTAATYYVDALRGSNANTGLSEQAPFATIQHAINSCTHGDTVVVLPGIYVGAGNVNLDYGGRAITVRSSQGPAHTMIDCLGLGRGVVFQSGEDLTAVLEGFTITHGNADRGGGILCDASSPTINSCYVLHNVGYSGGGIRVVRSHARITHCVIAHNNSTQGGAGIRCDYGPGSPEIVNCTIAHNTSVGYGGGFWAGYGANPLLSHCIVWGNVSGQEGQDMALSSESVLTVTYSDIPGGQLAIYPLSNGQLVWGEGNMNADPLFVNPQQSDYHLKSQRGRYSTEHDLWVLDDMTSPCIDGGDPLLSAADEPESMRLNLGAYGGTALASMALEDRSAAMTGDVDGNGTIEMSDLYALIEQWLSQYSVSF